MGNVESQKYRADLLNDINKSPDKAKRRAILEQAKTTTEYKEARRLKLESINRFVEDKEKISAVKARLDMGQVTPEITTTRQVAEELAGLQINRPEYSIENAVREKPLMHYSKAGNIFQILRFGIQSNNFKNRFDALRNGNPGANRLAQQMCGLCIKQGGSYQGADSISLSKFSEKLHTPPGNVLYLVNPRIKTFGDSDAERNPKSGYGHGIKGQLVAGEYAIGNPTAYRDEVLGANAIMPKELRAIVIDKSTSIISDMSRVVQENVKGFMQEKLRNSRASEDLVATAKLLAELAGNADIATKAQELQKQSDTMDYREICMKLISLQKKALVELVGTGKNLDEENLRQAIEKRFNIRFITK
ncbi:MAG: hypothetical protein Q7S01_00080 [bacterium]|nr:hypothetical protein [bacterium]